MLRKEHCVSLILSMYIEEESPVGKTVIIPLLHLLHKQPYKLLTFSTVQTVAMAVSGLALWCEIIYRSLCQEVLMSAVCVCVF